MTASNHFVTGAAISIAIANPWLGVPAAILSHFILDSIPHYGCKEFRDDNPGERKLYFLMLVIDGAILATLIAFSILALDNFLLIAYGLAAFSPDAVWFYRYGPLLWLGKVNKPPGRLERFHSKIQWFEETSGLLVEVPYFLAVGGLVLWLICHLYTSPSPRHRG